MTRPKPKPLPDIETVAEAIGVPVEKWRGQCHSISLAVVKSGILAEPARVARGRCRGVLSQHSWIVLGRDPYEPRAELLDPTGWHYWGEEPYLWTGKNLTQHYPHGNGSIWVAAPPPDPTGEIIELDLEARKNLSGEARGFLTMVEPLDYRGWHHLAHGPMRGWPAGDIITAMYRTEKLRVLIPIDIVGMVTDINPKGLYF